MSCAEKLDSPPGILPPLLGIENRHRHGRIRGQVPAMERSGIRQEIQFHARRIGEERGADVGAVPAGNRRYRAEPVRVEDLKETLLDSAAGT